MTHEEFAADIDALIAIARHEGLPDKRLFIVLQEALAELLQATEATKAVIVRLKIKPKPRPQPALVDSGGRRVRRGKLPVCSP
jgi:hypothetical protein